MLWQRVVLEAPLERIHTLNSYASSTPATDSRKVYVSFLDRDCSYVPSPIALGPYFLVVSDSGVTTCLDAKSGKSIWRKRIGARHSASMVYANGLVYFLSDKGVMTVVKPGPEFELVARNKLGEETNASPAINDGLMFPRGAKHLYCIGTGSK